MTKKAAVMQSIQSKDGKGKQIRHVRVGRNTSPLHGKKPRVNKRAKLVWNSSRKGTFVGQVKMDLH